MSRRKIENFIKEVWHKNDIRIPDDIDKIIEAISDFQDNYYQNNSDLINKKAKKDIRGLKASKKIFMSNSYTPKEVEKDFLFNSEDMKKIQHTEAFGMNRILHKDVVDYLSKRRKAK